MTEIDVDMAIHAIGQAVADLVAAAEDAEARGYVEANKERLFEDIDRLSESLAAMRGPTGAATTPRAGAVAAKRLRSPGNVNRRRFTPKTRVTSRIHAG